VPDSDALFLPRAGEAEIAPEKLRDYALNSEHATGAHKARVFAAALGITRSDWTFLRDQILSRLRESPVTAIRPKAPYVRIEIDGRNGATHRVVTGWLVPEAGPPRLTSAYVETPRRA
jgi:hypothetical protein